MAYDLVDAVRLNVDFLQAQRAFERAAEAVKCHRTAGARQEVFGQRLGYQGLVNERMTAPSTKLRALCPGLAVYGIPRPLVD